MSMTALRAPQHGALILILLGLLAAAFPAVASGQAVLPPGSPEPLGDELLSDERTITRWARVAPPDVRLRAVPARAGSSRSAGHSVRESPSPSARTIARLRPSTEHGSPNVYVVLRSQVDRLDRVWLEVRVPMRPNGRRGWVPREALGSFRVVRTRLEIDRRTLHARLFRSGRVIWRSRVGIGAPRTPTPAGTFFVRERLRPGNPRGLYGPVAFGTSAYSSLTNWALGGIVGIHGTNQPHLIPGRPSNGCVRVPNEAIRRLAALMPTGTPVHIR
jgi:hypothetical protein